MASRFTPEPLTRLSVLDRLVDEEPRVETDRVMNRFESARRFRASVLRDLEWLLNTRWTGPEIPEECEELAHSVFRYGLPDFSTYTASSTQERAKLLRELARAIQIFEPRLSHLAVYPPPDEEPQRGVFRFTISAVLRMEPAPEQIVFDSVLELRRGQCQLRES